jgi:hypothetical protein
MGKVSSIAGHHRRRLLECEAAMEKALGLLIVSSWVRDPGRIAQVDYEALEVLYAAQSPGRKKLQHAALKDAVKQAADIFRMKAPPRGITIDMDDERDWHYFSRNLKA